MNAITTCSSQGKNGFLTFRYAMFKRNSIVWPKVVITKSSEPLFFTGKKLQDFFFQIWNHFWYVSLIIKNCKFIIFCHFLGNLISFLYGFHFFFFRKYPKENKYKTKIKVYHKAMSFKLLFENLLWSLERHNKLTGYLSIIFILTTLVQIIRCLLLLLTY